jgi:hypothetical protein
MAKKSALAAGLDAAAGKRTEVKNGNGTPRKQPPATVLIGAHYPPTVRRALLMVQAEQEVPRNLKQLLGEAINDLCAKYGKPQPYEGEA